MNWENLKKPWMPWAIFGGALVIVLLLGLLTASIMERRSEALIAYKPLHPVKAFEPRNEIWGKNFPREYESYMKTREVALDSGEDQLAKDPRMVILWAGYGFSREYNKPKGHANAIDDIRKILRTGAPKDANDGPQPNTCWTCKSPDVPRMMKEMGVAEFYKGKWASLGHEIVNPIGCGDCHDSKTMDLVITRPALIEAFQRQGKDITKSSHQELRSLVCAQCHVEYYFKKEGNYLTFPQDKGTTVEDIEKYYDEYNFSDWTHSISKAPMLKAQHPDYEVWQLGIHAKRGLSCADCHMPYVSEGGIKFTDHHVKSPLRMINRTCQVCHRQSEEELKRNVVERQQKNLELRLNAEEALVKAHFDAKAAWDKGATEDMMKPALKLIRQSQWRWDYAAAGHGNSFHAPLEVARIYSNSALKANEARLELAKIHRKLGVESVVYPDISTKEKAQKLVGIDVAKLHEEKNVFMNGFMKEWDAKAKVRQDAWDKEYEKGMCDPSVK